RLPVRPCAERRSRASRGARIRGPAGAAPRERVVLGDPPAPPGGRDPARGGGARSAARDRGPRRGRRPARRDARLPDGEPRRRGGAAREAARLIRDAGQPSGPQVSAICGVLSYVKGRPSLAPHRLTLVESVRCLECDAIYAKPSGGGTVQANPGCPECGYVG